MGAGEGNFAPAIHRAAETQSSKSQSLTATGGSKQDKSDLNQTSKHRGIPGSSFLFSHLPCAQVLSDKKTLPTQKQRLEFTSWQLLLVSGLLPALATSHRLQFTDTSLRTLICQLLCTWHTCAVGGRTSEGQWRIRMDIIHGQSRGMMRDQEHQRKWQVNRGPWGEWLRGGAFTPVQMGTAQLETGWLLLCSCQQQWPLDNDPKQPLLRSLGCFSKSS